MVYIPFYITKVTFLVIKALNDFEFHNKFSTSTKTESAKRATHHDINNAENNKKNGLPEF